MVTKSAAAYQDKPRNGHYCAICSMFRAPGSCTLVKGPILRRGWCRYWEAK